MEQNCIAVEERGLDQIVQRVRCHVAIAYSPCRLQRPHVEIEPTVLEPVSAKAVALTAKLAKQGIQHVRRNIHHHIDIGVEGIAPLSREITW
ncbi:hypothetical protein CO666_29115 [Rhizobium chutanense]|uniref:Uncharacterized protein n=1 Tax=Rhizobium chutanense TaxID=2035448 RepID=A0A2A6J4I4_9HYPH|nr:hypothetical protein [Rhizobium chutanense]PDT00777.1 hypothetical protein CO666_29115 [Rhizobium chutanense]